MNEFCLSEVLKEKLYQAEQELGEHDKLIEIDTHLLDAWEYRDDIEVDPKVVNTLAVSIRENGQAQPIVLVPANEIFKAKQNEHVRYVVIAGFRRFLACRQLNKPVQAVVRNYNFDEAISCLIAENEKHDVSDFSLGVVCHNLLQSNFVTEDELCQQVGIQLPELKQLLSFSEVPASFWSKTFDIHNISSAQAVKIKRYWEKGQKYQQALLEVAPKIGRGKSKLAWEKALLKITGDFQEKPKEKPYEVSRNGKKLFSAKKNGQIKFYAAITKQKNFDELQKKIEELTLKFYNASQSKHQ